MPEASQAFDNAHYRMVLGHFPTGVTVVTGLTDDGPVGMAIGSFCSVSLDPPLVAFYPGRMSTSWPRIEVTGSFCVNVLAEDQEDISRIFASKDVDKFATIGWSKGPSGSPIIDGVLAWIDCGTEQILDAGDHFLVMGRINELEVAREAGPLVFYRGGYGRFDV